MKRLIIAASALLLCAVLAFPAFAADIYSEGFFHYTVEDESVTITDYFGREQDVTVPAMIAGAPVNTIGAGAFANTSVVNLYLPDTITIIEYGAIDAGVSVIYNSNVVPSATPEPAPTPTSTPEPMPFPTAEPAGTVEEAEISIPQTPPPTPVPTAAPTATPAPTAAPTPMPVMSPRPTVKPTARPTATPAPAAAETPILTPEPTLRPVVTQPQNPVTNVTEAENGGFIDAIIIIAAAAAVAVFCYVIIRKGKR